MLLRERPRTSAASIALPLPAPLPSLRDALQRRAAVFGPVDVEEAPAVPRGAWQAIGAGLRWMGDALDSLRAS